MSGDAPTTMPPARPGDRLWLLVAQGFGSGLLRPAPGTWGSLAGAAWTVLLLAVPHPAVYLAATAASVPVAIAASTRAERLLGRHDPGCVVIDEIVAMPVAFAGYALHWAAGTGRMPAWRDAHLWWPFLAAAFVLFRVFDVWKPWPIRRLQALPRGTGIVADDLAAGVAAALLLWGGTHALFWYRLVRG